MYWLLSICRSQLNSVVITNINDVSGQYDSLLGQSYTQQGPVVPQFVTRISRYSMTLDGQNYTIHNLYLNALSPYRAIFGYCQNAQIKDLSISNFKFTIQAQRLNALSILCADMENTTLRNINISINSVATQYDHMGLVGSNINNSIIINVTIGGSIHLANNVPTGVLADTMNSTQVSQLLLLANLSVNVTGSGLYLINQAEQSNISEVEVKNTVTVNTTTEYSFLFNSAVVVRLLNVIIYQNLTQSATIPQIYLVCKAGSSVYLNQTQFLVNVGQNHTIPVIQSVQLSSVVNSFYHTPMRLQGTSQLAVVSSGNVSSQYANFDLTRLIENMQKYYELMVLYQNTYFVNDKSLCGADLCGDQKQCQTFQSVTQNLFTVNYMRCVCTEDKTGEFCERCVSPRHVINTTTWQCEPSPDTRCLNYGGYDYTNGGCRTCDKGYAGQFCSDCIANNTHVNVTQVNGMCVLRCRNGVGGSCNVCQPGYQGSYCEECAFNYVQDGDVCVLDPIVRCSSHGGVNGGGTGCVQCQANHSGAFCDQCAPGFAYVEFLCRPDRSGSCKRPEDFDYIAQRCGACSKNATGDLCSECAPNYVNNSQGVCVADVSSICTENGGYDTVTGGCASCRQGYTGQFCDDPLDECCNDTTACTNFIANATACMVSYERYCANHGGVNASGAGCVRCQPGYTGAFCQQCASGFRRVNGSCAPDFASGVAPHCVRYDQYQCFQCERGYHGYLCEECLLGYQMLNGICQPVDATTEEPCHWHGGSTATGCALCYTGYLGSLCTRCANPDYIAFAGQCIYGYTAECADHGGYDPHSHACAACAHGFSGQFCNICESDTIVDGRCVVLEITSGPSTGLIVALVLLLILCIVFIALIIVYAIRQRKAKARESAYNGDEESQLVSRAQLNTPKVGAVRGGEQNPEPNESSQLYDSDGEKPDLTLNVRQAENNPAVDLDASLTAEKPRAVVRPRRFKMSTDLKNLTINQQK